MESSSSWTSQYSERLDYEGDGAEASSRPSSSSSPAKKYGFEYDIFLSFRGPDTRNGFTSHLYEALKGKGIDTFIDNEKLEKGQKVEELFECIEKSKIFVPIFSKGYADSKWCLKEIAKIVECKRLIVPVFFDVEPRDVCHPTTTGPFAPAFRSYFDDDNMDKDEVTKWSFALTEAGRISGYSLADTHRNEAKLVRLIVKRILNEVNKTSLFVAEHPVGLDSRIADVKEMLDLKDFNVRMVGIYGMGGIGKTTLAKAVYNQIYTRFDASSFIANVREAAKQSTGLVSLQEKLLRDFFNDENVNVSSIEHGMEIIQKRIHSKKVLLVLDDVDDQSQLKALARSQDWFCSGSRIIVTTRDKQVLRAQRMNPYQPKELDVAQSLELFSWHAFGKKDPNAKFADLSTEVALTAAGLPLALTIFGSIFFYLETVEEWEAMLAKLKAAQDKGIYEKLKISYDALEEEEKNVFLDIACFFVREGREHATLMWTACGLFSDMIIKVLMSKCLVSINDGNGQFEMHDHIRDMGRRIVKDESHSNPGMRSRLWEDDEALDVLQNMTGTRNVEAIKLPKCGESGSLKTKSFAKMAQLRMIQLGNVELEGRYKHLPKTLRWLKWSPQGLDSLPASLRLGEIVVLDLSGSSITQVWNQPRYSRIKVFDKLKVLHLRGCVNLTTCPNFSNMPHLEILNFRFCQKMRNLHPSIGLLKNLTHLNLSLCESLETLPKEVCQLTSLKRLYLRY